MRDGRERREGGRERREAGMDAPKTPIFIKSSFKKWYCLLDVPV